MQAEGHANIILMHSIFQIYLLFAIIIITITIWTLAEMKSQPK